MNHFFAQAVAFDWGSLAEYGIIGVVLGWFLWKAEPRMRSMEAAIDRMTRGNMVMLMEIQRTTHEGKRQAQALIDEIDVANKEREK